MRNDRVLIPVLHVAHDANCVSPCVYLCILVFSLTTIRQLNFITKILKFGLCEYKEDGSGCGFNRKLGLA